MRASLLSDDVHRRVLELGSRVAEQPLAYIVEDSERTSAVVSEVLFSVGGTLRSGMTTRDVHDRLVDQLWQRGLAPALFGYGGFPFGAVVSVGREVLGGLPSDRRLAAGEVVRLELGGVSGWSFALQAWTFVVEADPTRTMRMAARALNNGILRVNVGESVRAVGQAIGRTLEPTPLRTVRSHAGFTMGRSLVMQPSIPGWPDDEGAQPGGQGAEQSHFQLGQVANVLIVAKEGDVDVFRAGADLEADPGAPAEQAAEPAPTWTFLSRDEHPALVFSAMVVPTERGPKALSRVDAG